MAPPAVLPPNCFSRLPAVRGEKKIIKPQGATKKLMGRKQEETVSWCTGTRLVAIFACIGE